MPVVSRHRLFRLLPRPCQHEAGGHPHATRRELVDCVLTNGSPGFELVPEVRA